MSQNKSLSPLESDLWEAADQLRANSKLTASEYSMPVLGLIFLRHATNRFMKVKEKIEPTLPTRGGERATLKADHFKGKAAIYLPETAQYDYLVDLPEDKDIGQAILDAMKLIENQVEMLHGALLRVDSLAERLQLAMDNGAKRVLLPAENKRDFADIPTDILDKVQIIFYSDPITAAFRAMALD